MGTQATKKDVWENTSFCGNQSIVYFCTIYAVKPALQYKGPNMDLKKFSSHSSWWNGEIVEHNSFRF